MSNFKIQVGLSAVELGNKFKPQLTAVIEEEGIVSLLTSNIPFWTTITKFMQAFESEHKVGLYFYKRTRILDQKWGTLSTIKYDDPKVQFDESHFDESNVIAHFRTKDRTTSDDKKVLYIEEIQSDWGQQFRTQKGLLKPNQNHKKFEIML
mgnify:CR=1 FL=1